ncbi:MULTISPECIES: HAD family acid phosphatase [unclassified Streptomyces]|uniref:phosphatase domain-containing protein n=1 Tax=unclassified Streptomyces TaxID=2593676 RepID=UPI0027D7A15B|nr:HAD family acid phosphatase [Streptomyces sp. V1I6]
MTQSSRPLAVFDLDGTLSDAGHRQHLLERKPRAWDAFFAAAPEDPPLAEGVALCLKAAQECEVLYLTGRPERCRKDTVDWLAAQGLPQGRIFMRRNDDRRPARRTKLEILRQLSRDREIRMLVDDDELVCQDAERAGFRVVRAVWGAASTTPAMHQAQEREGRT